MKKLFIKITIFIATIFYGVRFLINKAFATSININLQVAYGSFPTQKKPLLIYSIIQTIISFLAIFSFLYSVILLGRIIYFKNRLKKIQNDPTLLNTKNTWLNKLHLYKKILLITSIVFIISSIILYILNYIRTAVVY